MTENCVAKRLKVSGIVQGVGFRPFVYQLAEQYGLKGEVANTSSGVSIHIEGLPEQVASFETDLAAKSPPLAYIVDISERRETVKQFTDFAITKSVGKSKRSTLISPDVSVCDDCRAEMLDPDDRRYNYPFINCTNCGPRYTIIDDIPYDRPKTSMRPFKMCPRCQAEYDDPNNRRFHAQPNACEVSLDAHLPVCGLCAVIRKDRGLNRVVLSGGVFQNSILLNGMIDALEERGFSVFSHQQVPTNDGGIALGQAVVAAAVSSSTLRLLRSASLPQTTPLQKPARPPTTINSPRFSSDRSSLAARAIMIR